MWELGKCGLLPAMRPQLRILTVCACVLVAAIPAIGAVHLPDLSKGVINGRVAVIAFARSHGRLMDTGACSMRLALMGETSAELTYPCGVWFQPPPGTYSSWVEKGDDVSPIQYPLVYSGGPFNGKGFGATFDVDPGGRVQLAPAISVSADEELRLINLDSYTAFPTLRRAFERRITAKDAHGSLLVPAGRIIAAIMDHDGNARTITGPVRVMPHQSATLTPEVPARGSDILVVLNRPRTYDKSTPDELRMTLTTDHVAPPNVFVATANRFYGVWYGVTASAGTLAISSQTLALPEEPIRLRAHHVTTVRRDLKVLPSIHVSVVAPARTFNDKTPFVTVVRLSGGEPVGHAELEDSSAELHSLPAERLRIELRAGPWRFIRRVDLRDYRDQDVTFELHPIMLSGTVFHGDDPTPGKLRFYTGATDTVEAVVNDDGHYQVTLWDARMYVAEVTIPGAAPYREYFVRVTDSGTRDFHVPETDYTAHVIDAKTDEPIAGAEIGVQNVFDPGDGQSQTTSQRVVTDRNGIAQLPPLRAGLARVMARAKGYLHSDTTSFTVGNENTSSSIAIALKRAANTADLALQFDGRPCAGAELAATIDAVDGPLIWHDTTDADGNIEIPETVAGAILLVRCPGAAMVARTWQPMQPTTTWQLPPPVSPLVVRAIGGDGDPMPFADVTLWLNGVALRGEALAFLTGTAPVTNRDGYWRSNAIGGEVEILVMRRYHAPALQTLAQTVVPPFPPTEVTVRGLE